MSDKYRLYGEIRKDTAQKVAQDIKNRQKRENYQPNDKALFNQGETWFNSGFSLEDADENLKTNINFINGFNRAKRIRDVEISLYELGVMFYNDGTSLESIPENYRNNPTVLRGYEDAKNNCVSLDNGAKKAGRK